MANAIPIPVHIRARYNNEWVKWRQRNPETTTGIDKYINTLAKPLGPPIPVATKAAYDSEWISIRLANPNSEVTLDDGREF